MVGVRHPWETTVSQGHGWVCACVSVATTSTTTSTSTSTCLPPSLPTDRPTDRQQRTGGVDGDDLVLAARVHEPAGDVQVVDGHVLRCTSTHQQHAGEWVSGHRKGSSRHPSTKWPYTPTALPPPVPFKPRPSMRAHAHLEEAAAALDVGERGRGRVARLEDGRDGVPHGAVRDRLHVY
jgi:hypothetical protein